MTHVEGQPAGARDSRAARHCAFCGVRISGAESATERFGEPLCSEGHAEAFAREVRAPRVRGAAVRAEPTAAGVAGRVVEAPAIAHEATPPRRRRSGRWLTWVCCGAPLVLLLALPLVTSGGEAVAAAGSVLSVLALLACPVAMFLMMRGMGGMNHGDDAGQSGRGTAEKKGG